MPRFEKKCLFSDKLLGACLRMNIRQMDASDLDAVAALEADVCSSWNREQIAAELQRKTGFALIALSTSGLEGWCCAFQVGAEAEILKIAVAPQRRRKEIGTTLLNALIRQLAKNGVEQVFLEVRSRNYPALQLYKKLAWIETGRRRNYYKKPADDAVICVRSIPNDKV